MFILSDIRKIYNNLQDEISKKLFLVRINYSVTGDLSIIMGIEPEYRNLNADIEQFAKQIQELATEKVLICGAGGEGHALVRDFPTLNVVAFLDNYRTDSWDEETGLPIYSLCHYGNKKENKKFIIAVSKRDSEKKIHSQLLAEGIKEHDIIICPPDWRNNTSQYFDLFVPREHEVFIDCGCFDGGTAFRFAGWCGGLGYDRIISFEPDEQLYFKCREVLEPLGKCQLYPYGVSDQAGEAFFLSNGSENSRIIQDNNASLENLSRIKTVQLDDFLKGERVTFIKMDIEGAEFSALVGASDMIEKQKPRLAISLYHKADHIISIPKLLLELRPDYKLWIRHYSLLPNETVLYAE